MNKTIWYPFSREYNRYSEEYFFAQKLMGSKTKLYCHYMDIFQNTLCSTKENTGLERHEMLF